MSSDLSKLAREAEKLSTKDRARLIRRLLSSLDRKDDGDVEQAWLDEAEKRLLAYRNGKTTTRPGDEVIDEILSQL
jgi:putative addiction module component (TIGR02574 family)